MKFTFKSEILLIILVLGAWAAGFYFYSVFPETVPVHWNIAGEVDRYGSRFEGAFILPIVVTAMYLLFLFIPLIDPKKEKYQQFQNVYHIFRYILILIMWVIYLIASFNGLGYNIRVEIWIPLTIGLLFIILGNYMGKIKPNWFMGIRTPWTLSNDEVWNKTHRLGGKLFMLMGLLLMLSPVLPWQSLTLTLIIPVSIIALVPVVYSYLLYRKIKK
ncbi:MAG: hypothetical protein UV78_C0043G0015 [Parcubacteria group bacterium GW2011_GWA2_43_17]|nr:MAG: hypothetical protein UV78_C0043G0015 [Parcubacteria group bacterium GW2011_GWA2_43_17]KKT92480.1 MAG: hypothetical protein UW91_C0021G0016 [Parcubacteria group bacterium GW2011_GWF2_45_11]KKT97241.1 MAG: hypothetical protein UW98_C0021G0016 [Parcubacteria group bacterium GW2011_GWC2_45_15]OGY93891.1 MAG: hypothetical protein A2260_01270 [Candidatus Komeilibacteria bacterium RIFOXYA2_FULL_45_9]OGY95631.1 MAG: hypothetical protein A3J95_04390 [Candidatus Komeilibacteria bacterium RIFOXYC2